MDNYTVPQIIDLQKCQPATVVIDAMEYFEAHEFPANTLPYMDGRVIVALNAVRRMFGTPISPSPIRGAHVREEGSTTGRHYIGNGRLSDATDFFPHRNPVGCWMACMSVGMIGGIGIYLDTRNGNIRSGLVPMLHIDVRPRTDTGARTLWMRLRDGSYIYPHTNYASQMRFFEELALLAELDF